MPRIPNIKQKDQKLHSSHVLPQSFGRFKQWSETGLAVHGLYTCYGSGTTRNEGGKELNKATYLNIQVFLNLHVQVGNNISCTVSLGHALCCKWRAN